MTGSGRIRADRVRASESLYGPRRAERPSDLRGRSAVCPFCPGNEHLTGALLTVDPGRDWSSRVIANIYPAIEEPDGRHEVIVEMRSHDGRWTDLDRASIERILSVYREREATGYADGCAFVPIFKNSGAAAGASLTHPHAQVIAFRALPLSIAARLERLTEQCLVCEAIRGRPAGVVAECGSVVAYVPDGSRTAFEVRIAPHTHSARFSGCSQAVLGDLAQAVEGVLGRLAATLGEAFPFNMIVQSAPLAARAAALWHWELELVPRIESFGGFEVGVGGFLVSRSPEEAVRILRAAGDAVHA